MTKTLLFCAVAPVLAVAVPVAAAPVAAQRSDRFVDSIGVNTHWSYPNVYSNFAAEVKAKLVESGIRHVRDGISSATTTRAGELESAGIKHLIIADSRLNGILNPSKIPLILDSIRPVASAVSGIEGPNEYDNRYPPETGWNTNLFNYQSQLFNAVQADATLQNLPVIGPSHVSQAAYNTMGDLSAICDAGNIHPYQTWRHPETTGWGTGGYGSIAYNIGLANVQAPGKPVWATEGGYQTSAALDYVSEAAEAKYLPRMWATFFQSGVFRTYKYEFVNQGTTTTDDQMHYGLLRNDRTEKPAFGATKNLISALSDARFDGTKWRSMLAAPGSLDYSISGAPSDLKQLLLQKSDGTFYLLLWRGAVSYSSSHTDVTVSPVAVTVNVATPFLAAQLNRPNNNNTWGAISTSSGSFSVNLDDRMAIVRIFPTTLNYQPEVLEYVASSGDATATAEEAAMSNGQIRSFNANASGDSFTLRLQVPRSGSYQLYVGAKKWNNRGRYQVASAAPGGSFTNHGSVQDLYASSASRVETLIATLNYTTAGPRDFRFTVSGKNASSSGFALPIDNVKLVYTGTTTASVSGGSS